MILMGGLYITVVAGMRFLRTSDAYQDVIRQAHLGLHKMSQELSNGSQQSLSFSALPQQHVVFLSPEVALPDKLAWDYLGTDLRYHKWVCFYHSAGQQSLLRCELPLPGPVTLLTLPAAPNFATALLPRPTSTLARFIQNLEFSAGPTSSYLDIIVTAERETASNRRTRLEVRANVRLENP